jgi:hypothetical protein
MSHTAPPEHAPQSSACPQPSLIAPQYCPPANAQVVGVQPGFPQRFGTPVPPQVSGDEQLDPQSIERPQPSPTLPQYVPPAGEQLIRLAAQPGIPHSPGIMAPHT